MNFFSTKCCTRRTRVKVTEHKNFKTSVRQISAPRCQTPYLGFPYYLFKPRCWYIAIYCTFFRFLDNTVVVLKMSHYQAGLIINGVGCVFFSGFS